MHTNPVIEDAGEFVVMLEKIADLWADYFELLNVIQEKTFDIIRTNQ